MLQLLTGRVQDLQTKFEKSAKFEGKNHGRHTQGVCGEDRYFRFRSPVPKHKQIKPKERTTKSCDYLRGQLVVFHRDMRREKLYERGPTLSRSTGTRQQPKVPHRHSRISFGPENDVNLSLQELLATMEATVAATPVLRLRHK